MDWECWAVVKKGKIKFVIGRVTNKSVGRFVS